MNIITAIYPYYTTFTSFCQYQNEFIFFILCNIDWGKKKNPKGRWIAHCGNLDTFFDNNTVIKKIFINGIKRICDDGATRFLVPEVNSGAEDLKLIIKDVLGQ